MNTRCCNLTKQGKTCRNAGTIEVRYVRGYTSRHCPKHYAFWFGRFASVMLL